MSSVPTIRRHSERARTDTDELHAILDAGSVGVLCTVAGGQPLAVPLLYGRDEDRILLHGSTGAGALRAAAERAPVAFCVTHLDGIVVADSLFESSANYRSAVVHGVARALEGEAAEQAVVALSDRIIPGRSEEVRRSSRKELAATLVLELPIVAGQWTAKVRSGPPAAGDTGPGGPLEAEGPMWVGVVRLRTVAGPLEPAPWVPTDMPPPPSVTKLINGG